MPLYEYACAKGHVTTELRAVDLRSTPTWCRICNGIATKAIITPPRVFGDFEGYESPVSGRWIEGKRQRREDFERTGYRAWEEGDREKAAQNRADRIKKEEALIDEAVERTAAQLEIRE